MNYLLDTHTMIWYLEDVSKISSKVKEILKSTDAKKHFSSVSLWEIVIKVSLGKLNLSILFDELVAIITNSDVNILQIESEYLKHLSLLPYIHKDPFDRIIIATALADSLTIITADDNIQKYDVPWIW